MGKRESLKDALAQLRHKRLLPYEKRPPEHTFTRRFHRDLRRQYNTYRWRRRRKSIWDKRKDLSVLFLGTLVALGLLPAVYETWGADFLLRQNVSVENELTVQMELDYYAVSAPPEGYDLFSMTVTSDGLDQVWQNERLHRIGFTQERLTQSVPMASGEPLPVWGVEGVAYTEDGVNALQWVAGDCVYWLWSEGTKLAAESLVPSLTWWDVTKTSRGTELPPVAESYDPAQAKSDGCMVLTTFSVENEDVLTDFLTVLEKEEAGALRICDYRLGDGMAPAVFELTVEGQDLYLTEDYSRLSNQTVRYAQGRYQSASLLELGEEKTLFLYAQGETQPKQLVAYHSARS